MPTVAELTNAAGPMPFAVATGVWGLARSICRVVWLTPDRVAGPLQPGDLIVASAAEWVSTGLGVDELGRLRVAAVILVGGQGEIVGADPKPGCTPILVPFATVPLDR